MSRKIVSMIVCCAIGCTVEAPAPESSQTEDLAQPTFAYHSAGTADEAIVPIASSVGAIHPDSITPDDVFQEFCTNANGYKICVSYDFTSRTASSNVQNQTSRNRSTHIRVRNSGGSILAQTLVTLTPNEFRGVFKSGINAATYCSEAQEGSGEIDGICHAF